MHELSIAMSIIDLVTEEAAVRGNGPVLAVHLRLGSLSGVVKEALLSCYQMACASTSLEGSQLLIEEVPVEVFCPECQARRRIASPQSMCCPECGTLCPEVIQGKELQLVALEIKG
jgi:hydrogenase nickel incorporation protein HypA/HybF